MSRPVNARRVASKSVIQRCLFSVNGDQVTQAVFRYRAGDPLVVRIDLDTYDEHGKKCVREWHFLRDDITAAFRRPVGIAGIGDIRLWSDGEAFTILIDNPGATCELMTKKAIVSSFIKETNGLVPQCSRKNKASTCTDTECLECQLVERIVDPWRGSR